MLAEDPLRFVRAKESVKGLVTPFNSEQRCRPHLRRRYSRRLATPTITTFFGASGAFSWLVPALHYTTAIAAVPSIADVIGGTSQDGVLYHRHLERFVAAHNPLTAPYLPSIADVCGGTSQDGVLYHRHLERFVAAHNPLTAPYLPSIADVCGGTSQDGVLYHRHLERFVAAHNPLTAPYLLRTPWQTGYTPIRFASP